MTSEEQAALDREVRAVEGVVITKAEAAAGAGPEPSPEEEKPTMTSGQALTLLTRLATRLFMPAWEVTDEECAMFGEPAGAVCDKWLPSLLSGPEVALIAAAGMIALPRLLAGTPLRNPDPKKDDGTPAG